LGVATLHEAARRRGLLHGIRLLVGKGFAGPAITVTLPAGDNLGLHLALEAAEPGSVVCVGSAGGGSYGVLGDMLFESARTRGVAGLVIADGIRDLGALRAPPGLAALSTSAQGTIKSRLRSTVGAGTALGGVFVSTGDWIICDHDGACVIPDEELQTVLAGAGTRETRESVLRERLKSGETTREVLALPQDAHASLRTSFP
jgi:4-hydroxy-4-methyl-2-oxoglutarate aldolase